jgi:putative sterol carrier protein
MRGNSMTEIDVRDMMTQIPNYFNPKKAQGVVAVIQCFFTGNQASNWVINIQDQICKVDEGVAEDPDITIKAKAETGVKLFRGEMDPMKAFLLGRVKVSGDLNLGMKLVDFFDRP